MLAEVDEEEVWSPELLLCSAVPLVAEIKAGVQIPQGPVTKDTMNRMD